MTARWMKLALGVAILISPLVAEFAYMCRDGGLRPALAAFGIVAVIVVWIWLGATLVIDARKAR